MQARGLVRLLTTEVAEDLKKKAEAKFEAELEAKLRLENKQKGKAFRDATIASPFGGLYEVASVAEHEGETEITVDVSLRWRVEAIKADYFVTPAVEFRLEDHGAGPMPWLMRIERLEGSLTPARLRAHGDMFLKRRKQTGALYIFHFLRYIFFCTYFFSLDIYFL